MKFSGKTYEAIAEEKAQSSPLRTLIDPKYVGGIVAFLCSGDADMITGQDLKGELDGKRHNCMQCHVPQVRIPPAVANIFEGEFRDPKSKQRSNLIDNLNEGVELE